MFTHDASLFKHLLWEYRIFTPTLSGKQLGRKTRLGVNGKAAGSQTNNFTEYPLRGEILEDYRECTSYCTTKFSPHI
jgi:hypothetical protein